MNATWFFVGFVGVICLYAVWLIGYRSGQKSIADLVDMIEGHDDEFMASHHGQENHPD
jgi:hypothetical protein